MKKRSKEEFIALNANLLEEMELFEMEMKYEKALLEFREIYESWYDDRITLDECLTRMMENMKLCKLISVWGSQ